MANSLEVNIHPDSGQQREAMASASPRSRIRRLAEAAGIHGLGFTHTASLDGARADFERAAQAGFIPAGSFDSRGDQDRRFTPSARLKGARTVITAYLSYHNGEEVPDDPGLGVIAPYTRANYYKDLESRLRQVAGTMEQEFGAACRTSSNYVVLAEKALAARSGLGFYGKNGIIITRRNGSFVVLGEIVTDLDLEPDTSLDMNCGDCTACIYACPTGAIRQPGFVDRRVCIQYISERRGTVPQDIRAVWGRRLYGCSTCQDVCPFNADIPAAAPEVSVGLVGAAVPLDEVIRMREREFARRFDNNQIGRRQCNAIRRNAVIAAGHSGLESLAEPVESCLNDPDPMIRGHAVWALAKIRGPEARRAVERALSREWDPIVRQEAAGVLDELT